MGNLSVSHRLMRTVVLVLLVSLMATPYSFGEEVPAQTQPQPAVQGQPAPAQSATPATATPRAPQSKAVVKNDQYSFFFDDADLFEFLQTVFGEVLKVNYMIDPKLKGSVNLRTAKPIQKDDVLPIIERVLKLNGFGILKDDDLYRIVPLGEIPSEAPRIYVYPVRNGKAKDVTQILQQIFTGGSAPKAPAQTGTASAAATSGAMLSGSTKIMSDDVTNTVIVLASPEDYALIEQTLEKIDIVPRQVLIEGFITEVTLSDNWSLGFAWSLKSELGLELTGNMGQNPSDISGIDPRRPLTGTGFTLIGSDRNNIVRARLQALAKENKVKLLASPHILVSDNREARIQVGQQVPIVTSETPVSGTTNIQRTIQYRDVGIILKVKPLVNESGLVTLEIYQEVSFVSGQVQGTTEIVLDKTEATTHLVSQDGQTIIIGGLIREDISKERTGIPILSKIPLLGYLFSNTSKNNSRRELIILLTPHVIRNQEEASDTTQKYIDKFKEETKSAPLMDKTSQEKQQ